MIIIAICDDSESILANTRNLIRKYASETEQEIKICEYTSGVQLLDKYTGNYDIIFLDVKMPFMDGIQTAKEIRGRDKDVSIIFLTSLLQYALEGYKVDAASYIIKPIGYKRMKMELDLWRRRHIGDNEEFLVVKNDNGFYKIILKDIIYIETEHRNVLIHTKEGKFLCYKKLKVLEAELKEAGFSRCHSSYIVNLAYVESVEKMDARLLIGSMIPISKNKKRDFMKSLANYWGERI